jgi:Lon-like ATP-dependent protease
MTEGSEKTDDQEVTIPPVMEWVEAQCINNTADIEIPIALADQVIGQDEAVKVIKKAALQKRHVMLIGDPGTGKSMLARSMTEFMPSEELEDILAYPNNEDSNEPRIRVVPAGKGKDIVKSQKTEAMQRKMQKSQAIVMILFMIVALAAILAIEPVFRGEPINAMVLLLGIFIAVILWMAMGYRGNREEKLLIPKLLVSHDPTDTPSFIDATGAHAGALLGDVKHDPFQSGGLETPAHDRVDAGAIHKAHKGVLFIDEINMLKMESQQCLLTALQEKEFSIVGQSERSSGAMVKTEAVPCDFVLVAAGNLDALQGMHPALRSRVRGYGYEIYMKSVMDDTDENRKKLIRFVAQEVANDKKIPQFSKSGVGEIIHEAQRRAGRRGKLTLRLRELGGLVRVSGDLAREQESELVTGEHVLAAKKIARSLEQQVADRFIEHRKDYENFKWEGSEVGVVNGLGVFFGDSSLAEFSGVVLPIVAEVTPAHSKERGAIIATGKLGELAKESVLNVTALIKKYTGQDISNYDVHIQFVGSRDGTEGDSASVSVATAVISALEEIPIDQGVAMTGSLSIRGVVLPIGGVTAKIEAAAEAGIHKIIIPKANLKDVLLEEKYKGMVEIFPVENLGDVLNHAFLGPKKANFLDKLSKVMSKTSVKQASPRPA